MRGLLSQPICAREGKNGLPSTNCEHSTAELGHGHTFFSLTVNHTAPTVRPSAHAEPQKVVAGSDITRWKFHGYVNEKLRAKSMPVCWHWVVSANSLYICALGVFNRHEPWDEGEPAIMTICHLSCLLVSLFMLALNVNFNCNEIHSNKCLLLPRQMTPSAQRTTHSK